MNPSPDTHLDATQGLDTVGRYLAAHGWPNGSAIWDMFVKIREAVNGQIKPGQPLNLEKEDKK